MSVFFRLEAPYRGEYRLHRLTFGSGGPVVALVAGIHGNEANGVYALNLVAGILSMRRPAGTVHLLPCVNSVGAAEGRKRWPFDDRDIAAAFPGDPDGLPVERIAAAVLEATVADLCVEMQTGSTVFHEYPHARAPVSGASLAHARATGLPVVWRRAGDRFQDGLCGAWRNEGRAAVILRGGRAGSLDMPEAQEMARGVVRLLASMGVLPHTEPAGPTLDADHVEDYRSGAGGFFIPEVRAGEAVGAGALLGHVRNPLGGDPIETIRARRDGRVLGVRIYPMAHAQELLVRIAEDKSA